MEHLHPKWKPSLKNMTLSETYDVRYINSSVPFKKRGKL